MRLRKLWIEGYGRFTGREIELCDGLQVIAGPNERGKSTLRSFIGDMLYGQKRSPMQRLYDDTNELRTPWNGHDHYGGRLTYGLDDGREIEVVRRFDRKNEFVQVFDRTHGREITREFPCLRNREPLFAEQHTGLAKDVFQNVATITHATLEVLGDQGSLNQIREKLLSLADTAEEGGSAEAALQRLQARVTAVGPPASRTRPLPATRARLVELQKEYEDTAVLRRELAALETELRDINVEMRGLQAHREALEGFLAAHERRRCADRLREAEELAKMIATNVELCFSLSAARDFPLDTLPELQRLENVVATARLQLARSQREREALRVQEAEETERLGPGMTAAAMQEIPESVEEQLHVFEQKGLRLRERVEELSKELERARQLGGEAYRHLEELPDFSRMNTDPVELFTQTASACQHAHRAVDEERAKLEGMRQNSADLQEGVAELTAIFGVFEDFPAESRDYQLKQELHEQQTGQLMSQKEALHNYMLEQQGRLPGLRTMAVLLFVGAGVCVAAAYLKNPGAYLVAALCGFGVIYFALAIYYARKSVAQARTEEQQAEKELADHNATQEERRATMQALLDQAGCETLRELEARYDRYQEQTGQLRAASVAVAAQETHLEEVVATAARLLEEARAWFAMADEVIPDTNALREAAARAVGKYQHYRDLKRRVMEQHDILKRYETERQEAEAALRQTLDEERELALDVRRQMRDNGFPDEKNHASARSALRAYRIRSAQCRSRRGRLDLLHEKLAALENECEQDEQALARHVQRFEERLRQAGVASAEEWRRRADEARAYQEYRTERQALEGQLRAVLQGEPLDDLRARVDAEGQGDEAPGDPAILRREVEETIVAIDRCREREHALQLILTERMAGMRSPNEIEEERATTERRVRKLELELQSATYAMNVIDEVARDRHARIAPRLAKRASTYLSEITGGVYQELFISRDLQVSVRIPQTQTLKEDPERRLSKGTVDQIYFALRMAMVQSLSEQNETVPMLLDDPFANYDDERLGRTMHLLARAAQGNQVLLFTCREDVIRAAEQAGAPIVRL
jgi:uncharacterized protein YhaN